MCQKHWDELRKAIKEKGMEHLVSKDAKKAVDRLKKQLGKQPVINDPLMEAHNAIVSAAIKQGGVYLLGEDENGNIEVFDLSHSKLFEQSWQIT